MISGVTLSDCSGLTLCLVVSALSVWVKKTPGLYSVFKITVLDSDSDPASSIVTASSNTSDYSPTVAATGFSRAQVGYMIKEVRRILGDAERRFLYHR